MKRKPQAKILALTLAAVVVALVGGGAGRAAQAAVPSNTAPPTITGTPTVGSTLTTDNGTWTGSPTSYAYQWTRCNAAGGSCVNESNGTDKTYTLVPGDAHHTIRVKVTATNSDGSTTATSAQTAVVAPKAGTGTAPRNTSAPTVSGTTTVGQELDANPGTWNGNPTFSYQWERCDADVVICSDVPGAHGNTYGVRTADLGYRLRVLVTGRNSSGSATAPSAPTDVVAPVVKPKNQHPTIALISAKFVGAQIYARFRICDDSFKNVTVTQTDTRPGKAAYTRRFSTLTAPQPCGVYTRHWEPVARFRGAGTYAFTFKATDKSGLSSATVRRSFTHG